MAPKRIAGWATAASAAIIGIATAVKSGKLNRTTLKSWRNNATTAVKTATNKVSERVAPAKGRNTKFGRKR